MISVLRCGKHTDQVGQLKTTACTLSGGMQIRKYSQCGRGWPFDGVTVFERGNLRLSWGSMAAILHLDQFPVKPQLVLNFANEDFLHLDPDWGTVAHEKQVVILRYNFKLCQNGVSDPQVELSRVNRRNFMHYCFLAVNGISNFVDLGSTCQQCGQERQVHVLIACEGSRKSVAILIVCMIFFLEKFL